MGASSSSTSMSGSGGNSPSMDRAVGMLRSGAFDLRDVALLTWEEFLAIVSDLNRRCRNIVDRKGRYLLFALKKGSSDSVLWKGTVRICCLQMNSTNQSIESRRIFNLPQFLRAAKSVSATLEQKIDSNNAARTGDANTSGETSASAAASNTTRNVMPESMTTSILMDQFASYSELCTSVCDTDLNSDCVVCLERRPDVILPCAHCYCRPCIEQWKETVHGDSCPVCRAKNDRQSDSDDWVVITDSDKPAQSDVNNYLLSMAEED